MGSFTYNGQSSNDFGLHIQSKQIYDAPEREREFQAIPGRSGDLILPNKRFSNAYVSYTCFFKTSVKNKVAEKMKQIKAWLYADCDEYHELSDSYDTDYFRWATPSTTLSVDEQFNQLGSFTITFNCKPHKYSNRGNIYIQNGTYGGYPWYSFTNSPVMQINPESFECLPVFEILTSGKFEMTFKDTDVATTQTRNEWVIGTTDTTITSVVIDCEKMTITNDDGANIITKFSVDSNCGGFPVWQGGHKLTVSWTSDANLNLKITPRWRTI